MLSYTEAGHGMPVVLLHGYPLCGAIWQAQHQALSKHFRVIAPDLRGHGKSPALPGVYDMELMARDVLGLLDTLAIRQAVIMGHSMGGYVTLAAWKVAPERFLALGLIASQTGADTEDGKQGRYKMADRVAAEGSKVVADAMVSRLFAPSLPAGAPIVEQVRQIILNTQPAGIIGALKGMAGRLDSSAALSNIGIPVLLVAGDEDQVIPPAKARAMASAIPTATLTMVAQAGHMPMLEQPDATTSAVRHFLDQIGAGERPIDVSPMHPYHHIEGATVVRRCLTCEQKLKRGIR